uniref:WD repeat-containing protein WRAP73 n=1 Tax=Macrostomum lignano TaxID=282301 RepID=A0A1I8II26_9PLAT
MNFSELIPFSGGSRLASFSPSGFYLAEAAQFRANVRDSKSLELLQSFACADQITDLAWSPDSLFLMCVMRKRALVQVWSLEHPDWACKIDEGVAGLVAACWAPDSRRVLTTADFNLRVTVWSLTDKTVAYLKHPKACSKYIAFSAYPLERGLGTKCVEWSPSSQFLAVGCYDGSLRLLNNITWEPLAEMRGQTCVEPPPSSSVSSSGIVAYREIESPSGLPRYEASPPGDPPIPIPVVKPDPSKPNPKVGIGAVHFSPCSRYVAFREDSQPGALWLWELNRLKPSALLLHRNPVRSFAWDPSAFNPPRLAIVTGTPCVYMWSTAGCLAAQVPLMDRCGAFVITSVSWHPDGDALLLTSDADACVCFLESGGAAGQAG